MLTQAPRVFRWGPERRFALACATLFLALALGGCADPVSDAFGGGKPVASAPRVRSFDVYVSEGASYSPLEGKTLHAFAFGLSPTGPFTVPGPEIRVRQGDHVRVTLHSAFHTIHWHGISLPWAMDGVPYMTQTLGDPKGGGGSYLYAFDANETGTYWYHCHVDAPVHMDAGMFGAFIVEPRDRSQDPAFSREYTLLFHETDSQQPLLVETASRERNASAEGIAPNPFDALAGAESGARMASDRAGLAAGDATGEYGGSEGPREYYPRDSLRYRPHYDTFMINGKSFPDTAPVLIRSGETIRIRLVNAGQLLHTIHLHGHHSLVTHKDGYNLPAPYYADTLVIGSGERYDVYVTGNNPGLWDFHDHGGAYDVGGYASNDHAFPGGMATMLVYEDFTGVPLPSPLPLTSGAFAAFAPIFGAHASHHASPSAPVAPPIAPAGEPSGGASQAHAHAHAIPVVGATAVPDPVPTSSSQ